MKKLLLLISIAILFIIACSTEGGEKQSVAKRQAHFISMDEARSQVIDILNIPSTGSRSNSFFGGKNITSSFTRNYTYYLNGREQNCDMYIFNFGDNEGYAAVLSDVRTDQLLALTTEGRVNEVETDLDALFPPLSFYEMEEPDTIDHGDSLLYPEPFDEYGEWTISTTGYGLYSYPNPNGEGNIAANFGMTKVRWHQEAPLNCYCFTDGGQQAVAGCAASALAILLSCYEYPNSYEGYSFNWSEMKRYPEAEDLSSTYQNQVARLMEVLGRSQNLHMNYGITSSGSSLNYVPQTLNNLGFSNTGTVTSYSLNDVINEINAGYPVIVSGKDQDGNNGHAWVIDAYLKRSREVRHYSASGSLVGTSTQTNYYVFCNWGKKLSSNIEHNFNGFYLNNYFNPVDMITITGSGVIVNQNPTQYYINDLQMVKSVRQ